MDAVCEPTSVEAIDAIVVDPDGTWHTTRPDGTEIT
jgi:hypothetical protein